jgi:hypothetical protein
MDDRLRVLSIATALLVLVAFGSACASAPATQAASPVPSLPTATSAATAAPTTTPELTATTTTVPTPEPTATTVEPTALVTPDSVPEESTRYLLTFEATWSAETHPTEFPPNPHFSGLIGATHRNGVRLWKEGETATPGTKNMAETGGKSPLDSEIEALITEGEACELISGGGITLSPGAVTVEFTASQDCPLVSLASMIAPSPDWFVGVAELSLYGDEGWIEEQVVALYPYDAGTDSGGSYTSPNEPTEEPEAIHRIETDPLLVEGRVPPLGVFRFTRLHQ